MQKFKVISDGTAIVLFDNSAVHYDVKQVLEYLAPESFVATQAGFSECLASGGDAGLLYFFGVSTSTDLDTSKMTEVYLQDTTWYYTHIKGAPGLVFNESFRQLLIQDKCNRPYYELKLTSINGVYQFDISSSAPEQYKQYSSLFANILKTGKIPQFA